MGGPLDGYVESMMLPLEPFLGVKTVPVDQSNTLVAILARVLRRERTDSVPLAVYELVDGDHRPSCYRYRGTQAVTADQIRTGCGLSKIVQRYSESTP